MSLYLCFIAAFEASHEVHVMRDAEALTHIVRIAMHIPSKLLANVACSCSRHDRHF